MNNDEIRGNPPKIDLPETHLHMPTNDARRTAGTGARRGDLYSIFREPPPSRLPEQDINPNKTEKKTENGALPPARAGIHRAPMALRPHNTWEIGGATDRRQKP